MLAETYTRLRQEEREAGARGAVRNDLQQKGVRAEVIEEAVGAGRYGETNEEALARQHLEPKADSKKPENEKETGARGAAAGGGGDRQRGRSTRFCAD